MDNHAVAERLVRLRGSRTQKEVAASLGISVSALSMYECGRRIPKDDIKLALSQYYRTPIAKLFYS